MQQNSRLLLLVSLLVCGALTACDPQDEVRRYFARLGLNQLAIAQTQIEPGAVFLADTSRRQASYADNMLHYATYTDGLPVEMRNGMTEFEAVLPSLERATQVEPTRALQFLDSFLPVNVSDSIELSSDVTISPIAAKVKRMRLPVIQGHLRSPQSVEFRQQMAVFQDSNPDLRITIAYEVYRTNRMRITARSGRDVSSSLNVGAVGPVGSGAFGLKYTKSTTSELLIEGDESFAFAVRAALIRRVEDMPTTPPLYTLSQLAVGFTGVPGQVIGRPSRFPDFGNDNAYSVSIGEEYEPLALVPLSELGL